MAGPTKIEEFLAEFAAIDDRDLRFEYLIELADRFRPVDPRVAVRPFAAEHRVPGCESEAYLWAEQTSERSLKFHFAVENPQGVSAKALAVILDENLSGRPLAEIRAVDPELVYVIFGRNLTMGKGQGLMGMIHMIRALAERQIAAGVKTSGTG